MGIDSNKIASEINQESRATKIQSFVSFFSLWKKVSNQDFPINVNGELIFQHKVHRQKVFR